jgi:large subunit ribosomal protein L2
MQVESINPTTAGSRHQINGQKYVLSKNNRILKAKMKYKNRRKGRSSIHGKITAWHRGGGNKLLIRTLGSSNKERIGLTISVQYDPIKTAFTSLKFDLKMKEFYFETTTNKILPGMISICEKNSPELRLGLRTRVMNIPLGSLVNNISCEGKIKYAKSAGTFAELIKIDDKKASLKLPSNKIVQVNKNAFATIGVVCNIQHNKTKLGKAGRKRHLRRRPIVRGIAMNPVDHPHGGRTNGGRPSVTPWGLPTKAGFSLKKRKNNVKN